MNSCTLIFNFLLVKSFYTFQCEDYFPCRENESKTGVDSPLFPVIFGAVTSKRNETDKSIFATCFVVVLM